MKSDDKYIPQDGGRGPIETIRPGAGMRVEVYDGIWTGSHPHWVGKPGHWSRLIDDATGEVLLDTSSIFTSKWTFREDGVLLLRLCYHGGIVNREEMFLIDPAARAWRDLAGAQPARPLVELSEAVLAAWWNARTNQFDRGTEWYARGIKTIERFYSPLGTVRCEQVDWEIVHSWGLVPSIYLTDTNEKIFDLGEWGEPALFAFEGENLLRVTLCNPGKTTIIFHPHERTARLAEGDEKPPLADLQRLLKLVPAAFAEAQLRAAGSGDAALLVAPSPEPPAVSVEPALLAAEPEDPAIAVARRAFDWKGLLFSLVPLLAGLGIIGTAAGQLSRDWAESRQARAWPTSAGRVTRSWVETGSTANNRGQSHDIYTPRVAYDYEILGRHYQSDRLSLTQANQDMARTNAEATLAPYPVGGPVVVHYDPLNPARAALVIEGPGSILYFLLGLGILLGLFGLYCLWRVLLPRPRRRSG